MDSVKQENKQSFSCNVCEKSFTQKSALKEHAHVHTGKKEYSCDICGKLIVTRSGLHKHKAAHMGIKKFSCNFCDKKFAEKARLEIHVRTHTGERPFSCDVCKESFICKSSLKQHQRVHTGAKPFACDLCDKRFAQKGQMMTHKEIHPGVKPFTCDKCGQSFWYNMNLLSHTRRVHTTLMSCELCGKSFCSPVTLRNHKRLHEGDLPFSCEVCGKRFPMKTSLSRHLLIHVGVPDLTCSVCDKSFSHVRNLNDHMSIHSEERPFLCGVCPKSFKTNCALRQHEQLHTGLKPYACNFCEKKFSNSSNIRAHVRKHHAEEVQIQEEAGYQHFFTKSLDQDQGGEFNHFLSDLIEPDDYAMQCDLCFETFQDSSIFEKHKLFHMKNFEIRLLNISLSGIYEKPDDRENDDDKPCLKVEEDQYIVYNGLDLEVLKDVNFCKEVSVENESYDDVNMELHVVGKEPEASQSNDFSTFMEKSDGCEPADDLASENNFVYEMSADELLDSESDVDNIEGVDDKNVSDVDIKVETDLTEEEGAEVPTEDEDLKFVNPPDNDNKGSEICRIGSEDMQTKEGNKSSSKMHIRVSDVKSDNIPNSVDNDAETFECPIESCQVLISLEDLTSGMGALHMIQSHNLEPQETVKVGLKWKKTTELS
eukprot:TRINITY_DN7988_c0_g1_i7.p1 TRINITY_DN7988_c0_g1~~TRINITY_DN7988_c0_g1_i7.p1  ORF type:complete len:651 (+),score=62.43 TRINITY_DN7988_c0_g1_i7:91-2043(+)